MPTLSHHTSNDFVKLLLIGNPKTGKTGSLISLVKAGYKLRVLDLDNLLDPLKYFITKDTPELLDNVEYRTIRDKFKSTSDGPIIDGQPKAFIEAVRMLDRWKYDDIDLGSPASWGTDTILVIDSLSRLCDAAYDWAEPLVPRGKGGQFDARAAYGTGQDAVEKIIAMLTGPNFRVNVIVIAHVSYMEQPDGSTMGFPQSLGQKLSPKIPQYFPSVVLYTNKGGKRTLQTNSTPLIDLANPKPFAIAPSYPIETGLADFFEVLRGPLHKPEPKPTTLNLKPQLRRI